MPCGLDLVLLGKRRDARAHPDASLIRREQIDLQRLHLPENGFDFGIPKVVPDGHHV